MSTVSTTYSISGRLNEVINYFLQRSQESGGKIPITNKKLQKLLYYAQAWNLVLNGEKLFQEDIEAWIHGPVIPSVYRKYKEYGHMPIQEKADFKKELFTDDELNTLNEVWRVYGKFDGDYLEMLSHSEEPWIIARGKAEADEKTTAIIDPIIMRSFYTEKNKR